MKKAIIIIVWVFLIGGAAFLFTFINREHKSMKCTIIDININSNGQSDFITKKDIEQILTLNDVSVNKKYITEINNEKIEKKILENAFVSSADAYTTNDGCLKVNVKQRRPLVRVINNRGESFYLDDESYMMPLSSKYTPRIIIAHGNITNNYSAGFKLINYPKKVRIDTNKLTDLQKVYVFCKYIDKSDFWKAMTEDVYVESNGDMVLYLTLGTQPVILGGADNLGEKLGKLKEFYQQKMSKLGWNKYKSINLKYKNQVVCSKN